MFKISTGYVYPAREWGWDEPEITESAYAKHVTDVWKKIVERSERLHSAAPTRAHRSPQIGALDNSNFLTDMFGEILGGKSAEDALKSAPRPRGAHIQGVRRQGRVAPPATGGERGTWPLPRFNVQPSECGPHPVRGPHLRWFKTVAARAGPRLADRLAVHPADGCCCCSG